MSRPILLVLDSHVACGRLTPIIHTLARTGESYLVLYQKTYEAHLRETERLLNVHIPSLSVESISTAAITAMRGCSRVARVLRRRRVLSEVGAMLEALSGAYRLRAVTRCVFARVGVRAVVLVLASKMLVGWHCALEAWRRNIRCTALPRRLTSKEECLANGSAIRITSHLGQFMARRCLTDAQYVERGGTVLLGAPLEDAVVSRKFFPGPVDFFARPLGAITQNLAYPYQESHWSETEATDMGQVEYHPSGEECFLGRDETESGPQTAYDAAWVRVRARMRDYQYLAMYNFADLYLERLAQSPEEEQRLHREALGQLNDVPRLLTVVVRHPRVLYGTMTEQLGNLPFENVELTPFVGMMMVPHCDACVGVGMSELNVHAALYGAVSVSIRPPQEGWGSFTTEEYWHYWRFKAPTVELIEDSRELTGLLRSRLARRRRTEPFGVLPERHQKGLDHLRRLIVGRS